MSDIVPLEGWSGSAEFTAEGTEFDRLLESVGGVSREVTLTFQRGWKKRLFSRPWRPLHGWVVLTGTVDVTGISATGPDDMYEVTMAGRDKLSEELRIRRPA